MEPSPGIVKFWEVPMTAIVGSRKCCVCRLLFYFGVYNPPISSGSGCLQVVKLHSQSCLDVAYRLRNRQFGAGIYIFVCFLLFSFKLLSFFWAMPRLHLPKSKTELYLSDSNSRLSHHKLKYKYLKNMEIVAFEYKTLWPSLMHFLVL